MITDVKAFNDADITSTCEKRIKMRLSDKAQSTIFQMFTKNVYSNPIGTVVREITSNCFDSHVEAGTDNAKNPVIIKHTVDKFVTDEKAETEQHYISFIDNGVGMSPERVENIYGVYFESTKNKSNDQIGGFGIGGKTPLAYTDTFFVITRFNGIEYFYNIFKGAESPEIELLGERTTTDCNGTEIRIPVMAKDLDKFNKEIERQLFYFENIVFVGFYNDDLLNNYNVYKGRTFLYRGKAYSSNVHVCLGKVAYPIDYSVLGLNSYNYAVPFAIQMGIGEIGVTVSRESLDYSEATISTLKKKLEEVKEEVFEMLSKQYDTLTTLEDYYTVKNNLGSLKLTANQIINVECWVNKKDVVFPNFKYRELPRIPNKREMIEDLFYSVKQYGIVSRSRWRNNGKTFNVELFADSFNDNIYQCTGEFVRKVQKQSYLNYLHNKCFHIMKPIELGNNYEELNYELKDSFSVSTIDANGNIFVPSAVVPLTTERAYELISELQDEVRKFVAESVPSYDELEVPADFIESRKKEKLSKEMLTSTICVNSYNGWNNKERVTLKVINDFKGTIYYGNTDDYEKVREGYGLYKKLFGDSKLAKIYSQGQFSIDHGVSFMIISKTNEKHLKMCKNVRHISTIYYKLLYRRLPNQANVSLLKNFRDKTDQISDLFRNPTFNEGLAKKYELIQNELNLYKSVTDDSTHIDYNSCLITPYIKNTGVTVKIKTMKIVDEMIELEAKHKETLRWIDLPYRTATLDFQSEEYISLFNLLKNVMVFK